MLSMHENPAMAAAAAAAVNGGHHNHAHHINGGHHVGIDDSLHGSGSMSAAAAAAAASGAAAHAAQAAQAHVVMMNNLAAAANAGYANATVNGIRTEPSSPNLTFNSHLSNANMNGHHDDHDSMNGLSPVPPSSAAVAARYLSEIERAAMFGAPQVLTHYILSLCHPHSSSIGYHRIILKHQQHCDMITVKMKVGHRYHHHDPWERLDLKFMWEM
jgi:hypothetical protein